MTNTIDVAIIGGGAAGIAAARRLADLGRAVLIIEALPRLGGRAYTRLIENMPLDLGCGWLHSPSRNPLAREAKIQGLSLEPGRGAWRHRLPAALAKLQNQKEGWAAYGRLAERLRHDPPASDRAGDALAPDDPWRGFTDAVSGFVNGAELGELSVRDFLAYEDAAGASNWRLPSGYGAFIAKFAAGLPLALSTRVLAVRQDDAMTVETERGQIRARAVIVTASSTVLAAGAITFTPSIDEHLHAASQLPLGLANKIFLALRDPRAVPSEAHLLGHVDRAATGSYYLRPLGRPVIECFVGGAQARWLEAEGEAAAVAFVKEELAGLFGSAFPATLTPLMVTTWGQEPTIGGSYSHAMPGNAAARAMLARPVSERLCLAGEACSPADFSTAHGAWESGRVAAEWIERSLDPRGAGAASSHGDRP